MGSGSACGFAAADIWKDRMENDSINKIINHHLTKCNSRYKKIWKALKTWDTSDTVIQQKICWIAFDIGKGHRIVKITK